MSVHLRVGEKVPLTLQLECFQTGVTYYAIAIVKDDDGALIQNVPLTPMGDGYFQDKSLSMPDKPFISARYETYLDSGYTQRAEYCQTLDLFTKDETETGGGNAETLSESFLVATITSDKLIGKIATQGQLRGEIGESDLVGEVVKTTTIIGEINNSNLIATMKECA